MTETAELRWFFPGAIPDAARDWFDAVAHEVREESRTDRYLVPDADDRGCKHREGRAETKTRTAQGEALACGRAGGLPEHWRKETVAELPTGETVDVAKRRRTCLAETSSASCVLELGAVEAWGETWWTVCLEATAADPDARERTLREASQRWLAHPDTPALPAEAARGYPAWLRARGR